MLWVERYSTHLGWQGQGLGPQGEGLGPQGQGLGPQGQGQKSWDQGQGLTSLSGAAICKVVFLLNRVISGAHMNHYKFFLSSVENLQTTAEGNHISQQGPGFLFKAIALGGKVKDKAVGFKAKANNSGLKTKT